jgi:hypothetical protein
VLELKAQCCTCVRVTWEIANLEGRTCCLRDFLIESTAFPHLFHFSAKHFTLSSSHSLFHPPLDSATFYLRSNLKMAPKKRGRAAVKADDTNNDDTQPKAGKRAKKGTKADTAKISDDVDDDVPQTASTGVSTSQSKPDHNVISDFFSRTTIKAQKNDAQKARTPHLSIPLDEGVNLQGSKCPEK